MSLDPPLSDAELLRRFVERGRRLQTDVTRILNERAKKEQAAVPVHRRHRNAPKGGAMNKTESAYAEKLEMQRIGGFISGWKYGSLSLRLAKRTWYRPDFLVTRFVAGIAKTHEIHEVKGHWEDDARAKFKIAAELYPMFVFRAVRRVRGEFQIIETLND